jgi:IclR family pca regulon transcriptional regulator
MANGVPGRAAGRGADAPVGPDEGDDDQRSAYVTVFNRGLAVIRAFSSDHPALTISDVAKLTGLNRSTARRLLHTLEADGYVRATDGRYRLRPSILELGYSHLSSLSVEQLLHRELAELAARLGEACSIGVLEGPEVVLIARAASPRPRMMAVTLSVGSRLPAYLSAIGRVILAELSEKELTVYLKSITPHRETPHTIVDRERMHEEIARIRSKGFALIDREVESGIVSAAVSIRPEGQRPLALSVAMSASVATLRTIQREYVPALREAATEIEYVLQLRN